MISCLRYALATLCFAASVGCLGLWWRSLSFNDYVFIRLSSFPRDIEMATDGGSGFLAFPPPRQISGYLLSTVGWEHVTSAIPIELQTATPPAMFEQTTTGYFFPLWYPALIFALGGVAALRLGRRFTLRSAIIATTVVAGLLGMAAAL